MKARTVGGEGKAPTSNHGLSRRSLRLELLTAYELLESKKWRRVTTEKLNIDIYIDYVYEVIMCRMYFARIFVCITNPPRPCLLLLFCFTAVCCCRVQSTSWLMSGRYSSLREDNVRDWERFVETWCSSLYIYPQIEGGARGLDWVRTLCVSCESRWLRLFVVVENWSTTLKLT